MEKAPVVIMEKTIGDTVYIVEYVIGEKARETAYDKVKKLILNASCEAEEKLVS